MKHHHFYPNPSDIPLLLSGKKTLLCAPVKPQPNEHHWSVLSKTCNYKQSSTLLRDTTRGCVAQFNDHYDFIDQDGNKRVGHEQNVSVLCPFGSDGDYLWGKETWCKGSDNALFSESMDEVAIYNQSPMGMEIDCRDHYWRKSITMPKAASRIWLKATGQNVVRAQNVTEEMAVKMGFEGMTLEEPLGMEFSAKDNFEWYWGHEYSNQDWLWICTVELIDKPITESNL